MEFGSEGGRMLFDLPDALSRCILCEWLTTEGIGCLDSALCNASLRSIFLAILSSDAFVLRDTWVDIFPWLTARKIKIRKACFDGYVHASTVVMYFGTVSAQPIKKISAQNTEGYTPLVLALVAVKCTHLRELILHRCDNIAGIDAVLQFVQQTLKRVDIRYCGNAKFDAMIAMCFPNLTSLSLQGIEDANMVDSILYAGGSVENLTLRDAAVDAQSLATLSKPPNKLQRLAVRGCPALSDSAVMELAYASPELYSLSLAGCAWLTNQCVHAFVASCPKLRAIVLEGGMFTADGVAGCQDRLNVLSLTSVQYDGHAQIQELAAQCRQISALALCGLTTFQPAAIRTLLVNLRSLIEVSLVRCPLSDECLHALAGNGQKLCLLDLSFSVGYTGKALSVLARSCAALIGVCVEPDNPVVTEGVRAFWKALHPGLKIVHDSAKLRSRWNLNAF